MNTLEIIKTRRSTRKFKPNAIESEDLNQIIEAGRYAPSGGNSQTSHFIVIQNKEVLDQLAQLVCQEFAKMEIVEGMYKSMASSIYQSKNGNYRFHYNAPCLIVMFNQESYSNNIADVSCCLENMMIMASAKDLGSVWINQLKWLNENPVIVDYLSQFGVEKGEKVYGALALGYPDTEDGKPNRTPLPRTGNKVTFVS
ncbi:MAG: nitroreductase [Firmicutes bacterium]|nr:nitroreductase [Bacillota bacterium]